jgi:hypothetical protein
MEHSRQNDLKKAFRDIKNGFSEIRVSENLFYLKHMSFEDQVDIDSIYDKYFEQAKLKGVPTHQETLDRLIEEKEWSKKQENEITQHEDFIANLMKQKKSLYLKSEIKRLNKEIEDAQIKLNDLKNTRASFFSRTAESYAEERVNDFYILKCLYKDKKIQVPAYTDEEFDDIDSESLHSIIKQYNNVYRLINDENIQKIVLQDFFNLFMPFAENPIDFFGRPICELTYNQLKLLVYARFFRNTFQQNENIPEDIKKDPDKIIDYVSANENAKKLKEKQSDKENIAESIVGATKEDLEYLNLKKPGQKTLSLSEEAKKKGGSLSMEDMMKLFGS